MASASLLSWLWFAFVSFVRSSGVYSVLIHTLRTFSAKHQCHTSHSGSLQQYQCSSGPWNIMLDHAISQYEICNITIWNMQYQYHTMQGNMKPWPFYEAYIHFQLRRFFSRLQNLVEPFHFFELHERCHLREGASRPWETSEKCSSEENSVLLTQSEVLDWFPDFLIVHFCFQSIQSIRQ